VDACGTCTGTDVCESNQCVATGVLRFTLTWDTTSDLDLHVIEPDVGMVSGEEIFFGNPSSANGGQFDVDDDCDDATSMGPENIYYASNAPIGEYLVLIVYYEDCDLVGATNYTLCVTDDGAETCFDGTVTGQDYTAYETYTTS
jgi:uncharacterized protein YfaP (DUF2135 family)